MRVAVLGASGFIGRADVRRLAVEPAMGVVAYTRDLPSLTSATGGISVTWASLDLSQREQGDGAIGHFDALIDCSGMVNQRDVVAPRRFYEFVEHQLHWIEKFFRAGCSRIVALSSGGTMYGNSEILP